VDAPSQPFATEVRPFGNAAIAHAAKLFGRGQPVAVPTETVYGLAGDAGDGEAVARIYAAKGRPGFNPLIVHVANLADAEMLGEFSDLAHSLANRFWPGPLTLVLPLRSGAPIAPLITAGLPTIAIRIPAHPAMQALLAAARTPLAAPSANASGRISPTRAEHVLASLGGRIPLIIDGGPTALGLESTIVAVKGDEARLLRSGPIPAESFGIPVATANSPSIESPGQLRSHYAPRKPLRLDAQGRRGGEWLIGFGPIEGDASLSVSGDLIEAAAKLFAALHEADRQPSASIGVAPIPETGLGAAINDRLRRAAAPRAMTEEDSRLSGG
jgi:L-threonylcarbamoyladenylate synthase